MPEMADLDRLRSGLLSLRDGVKGRVAGVEMDPALRAAGWDKYQDFRQWFDLRLDSAIESALEETEEQEPVEELERLEGEQRSLLEELQSGLGSGLAGGTSHGLFHL
jgi:hypothetical protein